MLTPDEFTINNEHKNNKLIVKTLRLLMQQSIWTPFSTIVDNFSITEIILTTRNIINNLIYNLYSSVAKLTQKNFSLCTRSGLRYKF